MTTPKGLSLYCRDINTPAKAIKSTTANIFGLINELGYNDTALIFKTHLFELNQFLNQGGGMTLQQIDFVVDELLTDDCWKWLNMADFALIIRRIKTSYYGKLYNSFDSCKFFEILREYDSERTNAIEQVRIEEASEYKKPMKDVFNYVKLKNDAQTQRKEQLEQLQRRRDEIAQEAQKNAKFTQQVKAIVDAEGITDESEYQKRFDEVWMELVMKGGAK